MKIKRRLAGTLLTVCLAGSLYSPQGRAAQPLAGSHSPASQAPATAQPPAAAQPPAYLPFAVGPGLDNLSAGDDMASYQWDLRNEGRIRRTQSRLNIESLGEMYLHQNENGEIDGVALPPVGPGNYDNISTDAVAGIDINIEPAWDLYNSVENKRYVTVAIIDTGIDYTHPDLEHAIWTNEDEIPDDGIDNDGNGYIDDVHGWNFYDGNNVLYTGEDDSHGTHAAGTIAAARDNGGIVGITDNRYVKIMVIKALGSDEGKGNTQAVLDAIRYAQDNGASICNLSFGSVHNDEEIARAIKDSPMLFVVAAGNGDDRDLGFNIDTTPVYPASLPSDNIITVANLMFDGKLEESSNYGPRSVDIAAPGTYILSTIADHSYGHMSGTSMSAPMVTGVAAMVYSGRPDLDLAGVKNAILSSAHKLDSLNGRVLSGGMLDAGAAMAYGAGQ